MHQHVISVALKPRLHMLAKPVWRSDMPFLVQEPMRGVAFLVHSASGTFREEEATVSSLFDSKSCHIAKRWRDCRDVLLE